jgi:hypothetical protein
MDSLAVPFGWYMFFHWPMSLGDYCRTSMYRIGAHV